MLFSGDTGTSNRPRQQEERGGRSEGLWSRLRQLFGFCGNSATRRKTQKNVFSPNTPPSSGDKVPAFFEQHGDSNCKSHCFSLSSGRRRFQISASVASVIVVVTSIVVVALSSVAVPIAFSLQSIKSVAEGGARASFAHCSDQVATLLSQPRNAGQSLQKMVTMAGLPNAPHFDTWDNTTQWYEPWLQAHLLYATHSNFSLYQEGTVFLDGQYVGCQNDVAPGSDTIWCIYAHAGVPGTDPRAPAASPYTRTNFSMSNGTFTGRDWGAFVYDGRTRPWFVAGMARLAWDTALRRTQGAVSSRVSDQTSPVAAPISFLDGDASGPSTNISNKIIQYEGFWADITFAGGPLVPMYNYIMPMYLASGVLVGLSSFQLELSRIDALFKELLSGLPQKVFLLDNRRLLIASSEPKSIIIRDQVPQGYVLTARDKKRNCAKDAKRNTIVCQHSSYSYGYRPLEQLRRQWSDALGPSVLPESYFSLSSTTVPSMTAASSTTTVTSAATTNPAIASSTVTSTTPTTSTSPSSAVNEAVLSSERLSDHGAFSSMSSDDTSLHNALGISNSACHRSGSVTLDGSSYYALVSSLKEGGLLGPSPLRSGMDWRVVVLVKDRDVTARLYTALYIAFAVVVAILVVSAVGVGCGIRLLLLPLAEVARQMQFSVFLSASSTDGSAADSLSSTFDEGEGEEGPHGRSGVSTQQRGEGGGSPLRKPRRALRLRVPSHLTEVALIQQSYWSMVDELRLLRGYIPEHLRKELIGGRRGGSCPLSTTSRPAGQSNLRLGGSGVESDTAYSDSGDHSMKVRERGNGEVANEDQSAQRTHKKLAGGKERPGPGSVATAVTGLQMEANYSGESESEELSEERSNGKEGGLTPRRLQQVPCLSANADSVAVEWLALTALSTQPVSKQCKGTLKTIAHESTPFSEGMTSASFNGISGENYPLNTMGITAENRTLGGVGEAAVSNLYHHVHEDDPIHTMDAHGDAFPFAIANPNSTNEARAAVAAEADAADLNQSNSNLRGIPATYGAALGQAVHNNNAFSAVAVGGYHAVGDAIGSSVSPCPHHLDTCIRSDATVDLSHRGVSTVGIRSDWGGLGRGGGEGAGALNSVGGGNLAAMPSAAAPLAILGGPEALLDQPVFFRDHVLVDRDISVSVVNIVQFHRYVLRHHGTDITRDHAEVVRLVHSTARRCGGVLETFLGDRFVVSFNATSRCLDHAVAATCFALEVSNVINKAAVAGLQHGKSGETPKAIGNSDTASPKRKSRRNAAKGGKGVAATTARKVFNAAPCGVTCGVATGRAFVGPLGIDAILRHTIISNAVPEACALERMAIRYPNCSVVVGGDMIPSIEGYFQYLLLDATLLPGSGGKRRRIASVKAAMCREGCRPEALRGLTELVAARNRRVTPYAIINASFNAFLEGRVEDCRSALEQTNRMIAERRAGMVPSVLDPTALIAATSAKSRTQEHRDTFGSTSQVVVVVDKPAHPPLSHPSTLSPPSHHASPRPPLIALTEEQCIDISMMCELIASFVNSPHGNVPGAPPPSDGRTYRSHMGDLYAPTNERILLDFPEEDEVGS